VAITNAKLIAGCIITVFVYIEIIIPITDYTVALLMWAFLSLRNTRKPWAAPMLIGIALCFAASAIQILKIKPSEQFNHNDLFALPSPTPFPSLFEHDVGLYFQQVPRHNAVCLHRLLQVM
jgi:hypothetical protein